MSVDFDDIFKTLQTEVETLAKSSLKKYTKEAIDDGKKFLNDTKDNLKRWTTLLSQGTLTKQDYEWLILSQKDLAQMHALKQAGLSLGNVDQFKLSLLNVVVGTVLDKLKIS